MFMFFSLLAASTDGFICGFVLGSMGIKLKTKDVFSAFVIIFLCCIFASLTGNMLAQTQLGKYINALGVVVMLYLAYTAFTGSITHIKPGSRIAAVSLSVAADAAVACLYLVMCGYNVFTVSVISAFLHSCLLYIGAKISGNIATDNMLIYSRYIRSAFFVTMAVCKLLDI